MAVLALKLLGLVLAGEVVIHFLFFLLGNLIGKGRKDTMTLVSILKGLLERTFVVISLFFVLTSSLMLLGALKIATRIKDEDKVSNDFFFIGNLISILFGILYYFVLKDQIGQSA